MSSTSDTPDPGRRQEKAREHPIRAAMLDLLDGEELRSAELKSRLPGEPALSVAAYHLTVLRDAGLITCVGGLYRLA